MKHWRVITVLELLPMALVISLVLVIIFFSYASSRWDLASHSRDLKESRNRLERNEYIYSARLSEINNFTFYEKMWLLTLEGRDCEVEESLFLVDYLCSRTPSISPVGTRNTSGIGWRIDPITGFSAYHRGCDLPAPYSTPVYATADGIVVRSEGSVGGYGNVVRIDHQNDYTTTYAHCSRLVVFVGDGVVKGDVIAYVGSTGRSTGAHLHYEVRVDGTPVDPMNYIVSGRVE